MVVVAEAKQASSSSCLVNCFSFFRHGVKLPTQQNARMSFTWNVRNWLLMHCVSFKMRYSRKTKLRCSTYDLRLDILDFRSEKRPNSNQTEPVILRRKAGGATPWGLPRPLCPSSPSLQSLRCLVRSSLGCQFATVISQGRTLSCIHLCIWDNQWSQCTMGKLKNGV